MKPKIRRKIMAIDHWGKYELFQEDNDFYWKDGEWKTQKFTSKDEAWERFKKGRINWYLD